MKNKARGQIRSCCSWERGELLNTWVGEGLTKVVWKGEGESRGCPGEAHSRCREQLVQRPWGSSMPGMDLRTTVRSSGLLSLDEHLGRQL